MKVQLKISTLTYITSKFVINFIIFILITLPTSIYFWLDFYKTNKFIDLLIIDIFSKFLFGANIIALQLILGILFRRRQSFIFKYLWVIMFISSHYIIIIFVDYTLEDWLVPIMLFMPFCFYPIYLKDLTAAYDEKETQITSLI